MSFLTGRWPMAISDIKRFHNQDDDYEAWRASSGDHVMNLSTRRRASPPGYMLHVSDCGHLSNSKGDLRVTRHPKWCGTRHDLTEWAIRETGEPPLLCPNCM